MRKEEIRARAELCLISDKGNLYEKVLDWVYIGGVIHGIFTGCCLGAGVFS